MRLRSGLWAAGPAARPPWLVFFGLRVALGPAEPALSPAAAVDACGVSSFVLLLMGVFRAVSAGFGGEKAAAEVVLRRRLELRGAGSCGQWAEQGRAAGSLGRRWGGERCCCQTWYPAAWWHKT